MLDVIYPNTVMAAGLKKPQKDSLRLPGWNFMRWSAKPSHTPVCFPSRELPSEEEFSCLTHGTRCCRQFCRHFRGRALSAE
ncbi:MAG: hypothetical protein DKINENOH_03117 [bacterium]|nr:hypothetical protein [bacterium]